MIDIVVDKNFDKCKLMYNGIYLTDDKSNVNGSIRLRLYVNRYIKKKTFNAR